MIPQVPFLGHHNMLRALICARGKVQAALFRLPSCDPQSAFLLAQPSFGW